MFHSLNIANFVLKNVKEHNHDSVELTIISQVEGGEGGKELNIQLRNQANT